MFVCIVVVNTVYFLYLQYCIVDMMFLITYICISIDIQFSATSLSAEALMFKESAESGMI